VTARILVVDDDKTLQLLLRLELSGEGFSVIAASDGTECLDMVAEEPPDLIILDYMMPDMNGIEVLKKLRQMPQLIRTPVILLTGHDIGASERDALEHGADHYMKKPFDVDTLVARVRAAVDRSGSARGFSPLTGLPGNARIQAELAIRIEQKLPLALIHADIDHFKAFNDRYGFVRGDEVIKYCGDVLLKAALAAEDCFVGHVGGDDFAIVLHPEGVEQYAKSALAAYDEGILDFYDPADAAAGYVELEDRMGNLTRFPPCSLSMGIVTNQLREIASPAEASSIAGEMKSFAKKQSGSNYQIDRRLN